MIKELVDYFCGEIGSEVLFDANVLILYLVGSTDIKYIEKVQATKEFSVMDYATLDYIISSKSKKIITNPNVLTEVSHFANQKDYFFKEELFGEFTNLICSSFEEEFIDSPKVSKDNSFNRLGLTDTSIIKLSEERTGVVTKDFDLYLELQKRNIPVLNFNHVRQYENK